MRRRTIVVYHLLAAMPVTASQYEQLLEDEYAWLCATLGLTRVSLILTHDNNLSDVPRYGGNPRRIEIPYSDGDLGVVQNPTPASLQRPRSWTTKDREGYLYWEEWRTTLWHEVSHQVDEQQGFGWDRGVKHGHGPTWNRALDWMAAQLGCPSGTVLKQLLPSMDL